MSNERVKDKHLSDRAARRPAAAMRLSRPGGTARHRTEFSQQTARRHVESSLSRSKALSSRSGTWCSKDSATWIGVLGCETSAFLTDGRWTQRSLRATTRSTSPGGRLPAHNRDDLLLPKARIPQESHRSRARIRFARVLPPRARSRRHATRKERGAHEGLTGKGPQKRRKTRFVRAAGGRECGDARSSSAASSLARSAS